MVYLDGPATATCCATTRQIGLETTFSLCY
jgi:hypothetical protein